MAVEDIGAIYNTKIPGLADSADIQSAFKLYHYGSLSYDSQNEDTSELLPSSMAHHLNDLQEQIDVLDQKRTAGDYLAVAPTNIPDGYIWVDSTTAGAIEQTYVQAFYSITPPVENLQNGIIWIDKSDETNPTYVWNSTTSQWDPINNISTIIDSKGDIIVGESENAYGVMQVGQNGYVLTADSSEEFGVKWAPAQNVEDTSSLKIELIMGVY